MEKILWCESKGISFPIPTHRIWDTCHLISYDFPIPTIFLPYEPKKALVCYTVRSDYGKPALIKQRIQTRCFRKRKWRAGLRDNKVKIKMKGRSRSVNKRPTREFFLVHLIKCHINWSVWISLLRKDRDRGPCPESIQGSIVLKKLSMDGTCGSSIIQTNQVMSIQIYFISTYCFYQRTITLVYNIFRMTIIYYKKGVA